MIINKIWYRIKINAINMRSTYYIKKNIKKKRNSEKAKIAFIVQMPEIWDKQEKVYEKMRQDKRVEVSLIVVPSYDFEKDILKPYGKEIEFFTNRYGDVVNAITDGGEVIDLEAMGFDYVFYQRPYDHYLPKQLRSSAAVKYAKVCHIPYGYTGGVIFRQNTYRGFYGNVYLGFMDSEEQCEGLNDTFKRNVKRGYQKFLNIGYPVLEKYMKMPVRSKIENLLWTPRWSYDEKIGGSHFVEYKDEFISLSEEKKGLNTIIRPHPLTFANMVKEGKMTEEEVEEYKERLENSNIILDKNENIDDTFEEADILVTDFSSIMIMYFLTGKPMIYCESSIQVNKSFAKMMEGVYVAKCWEDVEKYINHICSGNDYLKETREEIIKNEFSNVDGAANRIVDYIVDDYNR